mmetsp:Transcript_55326/g.103791  ORF Transcript_55326/g.103791 Transcript_55326/m.103791 type:complete len:256 (+) Transcript_55326:62-829(+)
MRRELLDINSLKVESLINEHFKASHWGVQHSLFVFPLLTMCPQNDLHHLADHIRNDRLLHGCIDDPGRVPVRLQKVHPLVCIDDHIQSKDLELANLCLFSNAFLHAKADLHADGLHLLPKVESERGNSVVLQEVFVQVLNGHELRGRGAREIILLFLELLFCDVAEQILTIEFILVVVLAATFDVPKIVMKRQEWLCTCHQHVHPRSKLPILNQHRIHHVFLDDAEVCEISLLQRRLLWVKDLYVLAPGAKWLFL